MSTTTQTAYDLLYRCRVRLATVSKKFVVVMVYRSFCKTRLSSLALRFPPVEQLCRNDNDPPEGTIEEPFRVPLRNKVHRHFSKPFSPHPEASNCSRRQSNSSLNISSPDTVTNGDHSHAIVSNCACVRRMADPAGRAHSSRTRYDRSSRQQTWQTNHPPRGRRK